VVSVQGLTPHDLRRSAVRNLMNAGVGQSTAMKITGHRTVSVFERYNIVSTEQLHEAIAMVSDNARTTQNGVSVSRKLLKSRGSSVVEQPIRNRQVAGSSPALGSTFLGSGPETWVTQCTGYMGNTLLSSLRSTTLKK